MHDDIVVSYTFNFQKKSLIIYTINEKNNKKSKIIVNGVLTHYFMNILEYNIILSVEERDILSFYDENKSILENQKAYCWPIDYEEREELEKFLAVNRYKYIKILASYGLCGWILAKEYMIL